MTTKGRRHLSVEGQGLPKKNAADATVPVQYIANLQQQIFFLERKIEALATPQKQDKEETLLATGQGPKAHLVAIQAEYAAKAKSDEETREKLQTGLNAARIGHERAKEDLAEAKRRAESEKVKVLEERQELTAEIVGLQRQLDVAALNQRSLNAELSQVRAEHAELKRVTEGACTEREVLESQVSARDDKLLKAQERENELYKELGELREDLEALRNKYAEEVGIRASRDQKRLEQKNSELEIARVTAATAEQEASANKLAYNHAITEVKRLTGQNSSLKERGDDLEHKLKYAEMDRDDARFLVERNKMVSVLARFMIRKMRARMAAAERHSTALTAADKALHGKLVKAEQLKAALDAELALERQSAAIREEYYEAQASDAVRMVASHREQEDRVKELEQEVSDLTSALNTNRDRVVELLAQVETLSSRRDLAKATAELGLEDLAALSRSHASVSEAISSLVTLYGPAQKV